MPNNALKLTGAASGFGRESSVQFKVHCPAAYRSVINPPEQMMIQYRYDTFSDRFFAGLIDGLLFIPIPFVDKFIVSAFGESLIIASWLTLSSFLYLFYSILMHGLWGQTVGKMRMYVRVLDVSETRLNMKQAVLRDIVPVVLNLIYVSLMWHLGLWFRITSNVQEYSLVLRLFGATNSL
ncbi:RDD family protein [Candidatus Latescibacterota bacterium]